MGDKKQKRPSQEYNASLAELMSSSMYKNKDFSIVEFCNRTGISYQRARRIRKASSKNTHIDNMASEVKSMGGELKIEILDKNKG